MNIHLNTLKSKYRRNFNNFRKEKLRLNQPISQSTTEVKNNFELDLDLFLKKQKGESDTIALLSKKINFFKPFDELHMAFNMNYYIFDSINPFKNDYDADSKNTINNLKYVEVQGTHTDIYNFFKSINRNEKKNALEKSFTYFLKSQLNVEKNIYCIESNNNNKPKFQRNYINLLHNEHIIDFHPKDNKEDSNIFFIEDVELDRVLNTLAKTPFFLLKTTTKLGFFILIKDFNSTSTFFSSNEQDKCLTIEKMKHFNLTHEIEQPFTNLNPIRTDNFWKGKNFSFSTDIENGLITINFHTKISLIRESIEFQPKFTTYYKNFETHLQDTNIYSQYWEPSKSIMPQWKIEQDNIPEYLHSFLPNFLSTNQLKKGYVIFCQGIKENWKFLKEEYELSQMIPMNHSIHTTNKTLKF